MTINLSGHDLDRSGFSCWLFLDEDREDTARELDAELLDISMFW